MVKKASDKSVSPVEARVARSQARRQSILDAAVRVFAQHGFRGGGLLSLAKEVGMSHVGVLHHFGSKQELLRAVVARRDAEEASVIDGSVPLTGLAAIQALARLGSQLVAQPLYPRLFTVLIAENLDPQDPLHGYFVARNQRMRGGLARAIREGQKQGEIRADIDADRIAAEVMSFIVGTQVQWLLDPDAIDVNGTYERYLARLLADIAVTSELQTPRQPKPA
jgi:AcrR family transcriptional regulator